MPETMEVPKSEYELQLELIQRLMRYWHIGKEYRRHYDNNWKRFWKLYYGEHWAGLATPVDVQPKTNMIFSAVETLTAVTVVNHPRPIVHPYYVDYLSFADKMQKTIDYVFNNSNFQEKLPQISRSMCVTGNGFVRVFFNQNINEIDLEVIDPNWVVIEPTATSIDEAMWVLISRPYSYDKIR